MKITLQENQEEIEVLNIRLVENQSLLNRYRKKGIPQINRSFEVLHVRLKMPQFTCITLQPLFDAYPNLEIIISEKAKKSFYQNIITLQNFLLDCFLQPKYMGLTIIQKYFWIMKAQQDFSRHKY